MSGTPQQHQPHNRQLGVTERPPEHLIVAALTFSASDAAGCRTTLESLRGMIRAELEDQLAAPEVETGELGYEPRHQDYGLTITVGFSTTGYEKLGVPSEQRPIDLQPLPPDLADNSGAGQGAVLPGEGDLVLKICADDIFVVEHVLRRVEHELTGQLAILWAQTGLQRFNTRQSQNAKRESRALIGFLDGVSNLNPGSPNDRDLIFTRHDGPAYPAVPTSDQYNGATFPTDLRSAPSANEPAALDGGTYLAVEVFMLKTSAWDQQSRSDQEASVGEDKQTGQRLPGALPASHVLKANPQRAGSDDQLRRFLRRGYALVRPDGASLGRGLVFIAFGRTLSTQVEFVQRAWLNNPNFPQVGAGADLLMSRFVEPRLQCGGFYFVPPLARPQQPWSWTI